MNDPASKLPNFNVVAVNISLGVADCPDIVGSLKLGHTGHKRASSRARFRRASTTIGEPTATELRLPVEAFRFSNPAIGTVVFVAH